MPKFRVPHSSIVHRIAAIALYRALLTQCRAAPLATEQREQLQNIVRNRFKQSRHVHSIKRLRVSFEAGYEAIDHLDAAVSGNDEAKEYITSLLERAPAKVKLAPSSKRRLVGQSGEKDKGDDTERISLFDRPLPLEKLTGRRHVPVLFNANHIPVLRLKKPQPASLSRFIDQRVKQRQARHDRRHQLNDDLKMAELEDEWDELIKDLPAQQGRTLEQAMLGARHKPKAVHEEVRWTDAVQDAIADVLQKLGEEKEKNRIMAEKMQAVVDRERELFEKERAERMEVKRAERLRRRQERRENAEHVTDEQREGATNEPIAMAK